MVLAALPLRGFLEIPHNFTTTNLEKCQMIKLRHRMNCIILRWLYVQNPLKNLSLK